MKSRFFQPSDFFYVSAAILSSLSGLAEAARHFHGMRLFFLALAIAFFVTLAMVWLRWSHLKGRQVDRWSPFLLWCVLLAVFAVLFPLAHRHIWGGAGSDRDDALRVSDLALVHGRYIYSAKTYLGNSVTPLPGAVFLALPFFFLGNVGLENLFWLALLLCFTGWFFHFRATGLVYVLLLFAASSTNFDDFVVGGDFLVNGIYVCIAMTLVLVACERKFPLWGQIASAVFLGIAIDSRPIYIVVFPLLLAYLWQRGDRAAAVRAVLISGLVAALLSIPFYLYDPAHFAPLHVRHKLDFISAKYHPALLFPLLGMLAACAGFFVRLTLPRVFLLMGISLFAMIGIPGVIHWFLAPFTFNGWFGLALFGVPALFWELWIFSQYEANSLALQHQAGHH